jgi:sec-independent protein translocase protein TatA
MLPGIGVFELVVVGVIAILLFGSKLPEVARNFGKSYGELRRGLSDLKSNIDNEINESERRNRFRPTAAIESRPVPSAEDIDEPTAPKLIPPSDSGS